MSRDTTAVVARRAETAPVRTEEIERLAEAAGYDVAATFTQVRPPDGAHQLGEGKARTAARAVAEHDADVLLVDNRLSPDQSRTLAGLCPPETRVLDRYRLVLDLFADGVGDRAAELQVELATLEYDLPRVRDAVAGRDGGLSKFTEKGTPVQDLEARIEACRRELATLERRQADRRQHRREEGFDLVALAGYTNAGKSTLLRRLADDLELEQAADDHPDRTATAAVADRLFRTLETTTRRATLDGRRLLVTDTVGLLDELPHDLVASFETTVAAATEADLTLVVADASDDHETFRRRLGVAWETLAEADRRLVVLNKRDRVDDATLAARRRTARTVTDGGPVVAASATAGDLEALHGAVHEWLPDLARERFVMPQGPATQRFLAWLHDHAVVEATSYEADRVTATVAGRAAVLEAARGRRPERDGDDTVPAG